MVQQGMNGVLGLFLMSPREVLVIVLITAVVVFLSMRGRKSN